MKKIIFIFIFYINAFASCGPDPIADIWTLITPMSVPPSDGSVVKLGSNYAQLTILSSTYSTSNTRCADVDGMYYDSSHYHFYSGLGTVSSPAHNVTYNAVSVVGCPSGQTLVNNVCTLPPPPDLSTYNNNPYLCIKNGGWPTGSFSNSTGLPFWKTGFSLKWVNKCSDQTGMINGTIPLIAGVTGNISGNPDLLGSLIAKGINKFKNFINGLLTAPNAVPLKNDYLLTLPKWDSSLNGYEPNIVSNPIPTGADGITPSRAPDLTVDPYNEFLNKTWFPQNPSLSPENQTINAATVGRFNTSNANFPDNGTDPITYIFTPNLANIWKSTTGSPTSGTTPMYSAPQMSPSPAYAPKGTIDAPTFRVVPPDSTFYPPVVVEKVADVPTTTVVSNGFDGSLPVKTWTVSKNFPDGSSSQEVTSINESLKRGVTNYTVISPDGFSNTIGYTFNVPNYVSGSSDPATMQAFKTSPVSNSPQTINTSTSGSIPSTSIDPTTGYPTSPSSGASTYQPASNLPTTSNGQDIVNAPMPSYSFPDLVDFVPFDVAPVNEMVTGTSELFGNIRTQLTAVKTTFDNTKTLLNGSWTPPAIPPGACGDSLVLNWHGRSIDLCPPIVNSTSKISPIVAPIVTLGGMALSITIFIGGF
jgi:hypothetical protein